MGCLPFLLLFVAIAFAGAGFAIHLLWLFAAVFLFCWLGGYAFGRGRDRAARRRLR